MPSYYLPKTWVSPLGFCLEVTLTFGREVQIPGNFAGRNSMSLLLRPFKCNFYEKCVKQDKTWLVSVFCLKNSWLLLFFDIHHMSIYLILLPYLISVFQLLKDSCPFGEVAPCNSHSPLSPPLYVGRDQMNPDNQRSILLMI